jgi:exopolysaccharide biosynthesis predicted pyruvyltransferase EpsI
VVVAAALFAAFWWKRKQQKETKVADVPLQSVTTNVPVVTEIHDVEVKVKLGGGNFGDVYQGVWQVRKK